MCQQQVKAGPGSCRRLLVVMLGLVWSWKGTLPLQLSTVTVCNGDPETSKTAQFRTFSVADILGDFHELNRKFRLLG